MSKLDVAIAFCGLFEAELLASLMMHHWEHPQASDKDLVNHLIESAAEILARSRNGERFFQDIPPEDMNFVAAFWYAESCQLVSTEDAEMAKRNEWLTRVRRALPGCFCDPVDLI